MKRKATTPLSLERPALRNLTNRSESTNTPALPKKKAVPKKLPNYLRPTFSTQQKSIKKTTDSDPKKQKYRNENEPSKNKVIKEPLKERKQIKRQTENIKVSKTLQPKPANVTSTSLNEILEPAAKNAAENLFGFEEESETKNSQTDKPEESFASPLRIDILPSRKALPCTPKPPVNHVLSVLKSSISSPLVSTPRTVERKLPEFFRSSASQQSTPAATFVDEPDLSFDRPPRRSYTRQRPLMNFAEFDTASDDEEKEEKTEPKVEQSKPKKKKKNTQDKQFEAMAAAMNSQFQQHFVH